MESQPLPTTVNELDRARLVILDERIKRMKAEIELVVQQRNNYLNNLSSKYNLKQDDSFNIDTGEITRK